MNLTWADIDFHEGQLYVTRKVKSGWIQAWQPKDHEMKTIPLSVQAISLLASWQSFSPENYPLLSQYCRHIVNARHTAQLIDQECSSPEMDVRQYMELLGAQHKQTAALKALAASMRLAQQAKYDTQKSAVAQKRVGTVKRPWEN